MIFQYRFFVNDTVPCPGYHPFMDDYRVGAIMLLGYAGAVEAETPEAALESLFYIFNMEHPQDYRQHSMSVGDVVELSTETDTAHYSCEMMGFRKLETNQFTLDRNPAWKTYAEYQAEHPHLPLGLVIST